METVRVLFLRCCIPRMWWQATHELPLNALSSLEKDFQPLMSLWYHCCQRMVRRHGKSDRRRQRFHRLTGARLSGTGGFPEQYLHILRHRAELSVPQLQIRRALSVSLCAIEILPPFLIHNQYLESRWQNRTKSAAQMGGARQVKRCESSFRKVVAGSGSREPWNTGSGPSAAATNQRHTL